MTNPWRLTETQCRLIAALVEHGNAKGVAAAVNTTHRSACNRLRRCYARMGVACDVKAALEWDRWTRKAA